MIRPDQNGFDPGGSHFDSEDRLSVLNGIEGSGGEGFRHVNCLLWAGGIMGKGRAGSKPVLQIVGEGFTTSVSGSVHVGS